MPRVCEVVAIRVVNQLGQAQLWFTGRDNYLAHYHACGSGGIPSLKFSASVGHNFAVWF